MPSYQQKKRCQNCGAITTAKVCGKCNAPTTALSDWSVIFRITSPEGKTMQKRLSGYAKKSEAERGYREFMRTYIKPQVTGELAKITLDAISYHYKEFLKPRIKESSFIDFQTVYCKYIAPFFGEMVINEITKKHILNWQTRIDNSTFSFKHKTKLRSCLNQIFQHAVYFYDLPINPVQAVPPFRNMEQKKEMQIWTLDEFAQFISVVKNPTYYALFELLYATGMRKGELLALTWSDINVETMQINITKSLTRKTSEGAYKITTPKNNSSVRKIWIPFAMLEILLDYKNSKKRVKSDHYIFGDSEPLACSTLDRYYANYLSIAEVKHIRLHDFRHTHASMLIAAGVSIVAVAKRLGHSNIEQTLNTYSHFVKSEEETMNNTLAQIFVTKM